MDLLDSLIARDSEELGLLYLFLKRFEPTKIWYSKVWDLIERDSTESFQRELYSSSNEWMYKERGELLVRLLLSLNYILEVPSIKYKAVGDFEANATAIFKETAKIVSDSNTNLGDINSIDDLVKWQLSRFFINLKARLLGLKDRNRELMLDMLKDFFQNRPHEEGVFLAGAASAKIYSGELMMEAFLDEHLGDYVYRWIDFFGYKVYKDLMQCLGSFHNLWGNTIGLDSRYHIDPGIAMLFNSGFIAVSIGKQGLVDISSRNIKKKIMPILLTQLALAPTTYIKDRRASVITQALDYYNELDKNYQDIDQSIRISGKIFTEIDGQQKQTENDIKTLKGEEKSLEKDTWEKQVHIVEYFIEHEEEIQDLSGLGFEEELDKISSLSMDISRLRDEIDDNEKKEGLWKRLSGQVSTIFKNQEIKRIEEGIRLEIRDIVTSLLKAWETGEQDLLKQYIEPGTLKELEELAVLQRELQHLSLELKIKDGEIKKRSRIMEELKQEIKAAEDELKGYEDEFPTLTELEE